MINVLYSFERGSELEYKTNFTAVHCCDPALSVLGMLVSRNVFHVVSALQSIVSLQLHTVNADRGMSHPANGN